MFQTIAIRGFVDFFVGCYYLIAVGALSIAFSSPGAAQAFTHLSADKPNVAVNDFVIFKIQLQSKVDSYACAFEIDFGDGSIRQKFRVFRESDAKLELSHRFSEVGVYAVKVNGALSLLDEGLSIGSLSSLLPTFPCEGSMTVSLNVVSADDLSGCARPPDEIRSVPCSNGSTGTIVQRRSFSCPGPTAQPWITESSDCGASSEPPVSAVSVSASVLINRGWASFVGRSGVVDEFEASRLTAEGVQKARSGTRQELTSIGINNLRVIHMCARDPRVRDYSFGRRVGSREVGKNRFSSENYIWGVFLRAEEADSEAFISFLRRELKGHPVTGYIEQNSGRLPKNSAEALRILKVAAEKSDHNAAKWVGYFYECGPAAIDVSAALKWMSLVAENASRNGASESIRGSINDRLTRLRLLDHP